MSSYTLSATVDADFAGRSRPPGTRSPARASGC